jgi:hypothetical protein
MIAAPRAYGFGPAATSSDPRPLVAIDVDGVIALDEDPAVPCTAHEVSAWRKWRRRILIPDGSTEVIATLSEHCEPAWASAWSYDAHEALRDALSLPREPWTFVPAQFHAEDAIAAYAGGRPWAWITEAVGLPAASSRQGGLIVAVDPRRGLPSIDVAAVLRHLGVGA